MTGSARRPSRGTEYERELREFRDAIAGGSTGATQAAELPLLRALIRRHPDQAREYLAELDGAT